MSGIPWREKIVSNLGRTALAETVVSTQIPMVVELSASLFPLRSRYPPDARLSGYVGEEHPGIVI
jgi:hypothetical protein